MITAEQARQIQDAYQAFVKQQTAKGVDGPVPPGRKDGSDYNQHFSTMEASGSDWDAYDAQVREILGLPPLESSLDFGALRADLDLEWDEIERAFNVNELRFKAGTSEGGRWRSMSDFASDLLKKWAGHEGPDDPLGEKDFNERQLRTILKDFRAAAEASGDSERVKRLTAPRMAAGMSEQQKVDQLKALLYRDTVASVGRERDSGVRVPEAPAKAVRKGVPKAAKKAAPEAPRLPSGGPDLTGANGLSSDPAVRAVQVENAVLEAFRGLHGRTDLPKSDRLIGNPDAGMPFTNLQDAMRKGGWVSIADIRDALGERYNRHEVDAALKKLSREDGIHITPQAAQQVLMQRDRDAAFHLGETDYHWIQVADPSPRPLPSGGGPDTPGGDGLDALEGNRLRSWAREFEVPGVDKKTDAQLRAALRKQGIGGPEVEHRKRLAEIEAEKAGQMRNPWNGPPSTKSVSTNGPDEAEGLDPNYAAAPDSEVFDAPDSEVRKAVENAWYDLTGGQSGKWVKLSDLREEIGPRYPFRQVNRVLRDINREPGGDVIGEINQKTLSQLDRDARVNIGYQPAHLLAFDGEQAKRIREEHASPAAPGGDLPSAPSRAPGRTSPGLRPSGLPTDRPLESGDFDDLAERIRGTSEQQKLEIFQDLNASELARLARKYPGLGASTSLAGSNRDQGLRIPPGLTTEQKRVWLARRLSGVRPAVEPAAAPGRAGGAPRKAAKPPEGFDVSQLEGLTVRQKRARLRAMGFSPEQIDELAPTAAMAKKAAPGRSASNSERPTAVTAASGLTVRRSLATATTIPHLNAAAQDEARRIAGRDVPFDLAGVHLDAAKEFAEGILRGLEHAPRRAKVTRVGSFGPGGSLNDEYFSEAEMGRYLHQSARAIHNPKTHVIALNTNAAGPDAIEALRASYADGAKAGWTPRNADNLGSSGIHELGHSIATPEIERRAERLVEREAIRRGYEHPGEIEFDEISGYAGQDRHELVAEAFLDVVTNGAQASALSRQIYDMLVGQK